MHSYNLRMLADRKAGKTDDAFAEPLRFLEYCRNLGAGGIQGSIGVRDEKYSMRLRRLAEKYEMYLEASIELPKDDSEMERFESELRTAADAGVSVARVVLIPTGGSGRRYEDYHSLQDFQKDRADAVRMLGKAVRIAEKKGVKLAIENHKDELVGERLETLSQISSECLGVCADFGNSFSLLEDPLEVIRAYAPYALTSHIRDLAVKEYEDGFLMWDVPLGQGFLDLTKMIELLRNANPLVRFNLELMTRDALKIPCLTEKYWAAMGNVPGINLARTLKMVRAKASQQPPPQISTLPVSEQFRLEDENVKKCLAYAGEHLGL